MESEEDLALMASTLNTAQALSRLVGVLGRLSGVPVLSHASDGKTLLLETSYGYFPLPLKAVCEQPFESARLLEGCCAAEAIGRFLS